MRNRFYALFFFSGFTSLAYEVLWVHALGRELGHSFWSMTTVLSSFMTGLAAGSWAVDRVKITAPLRAYAVCELGIAVLAVLVHPAVNSMSVLLDPIYQAVSPHFGWFAFARAATCFLVLLLPTTLMGATLPLLVAGLGPAEARTRIGSLYGINTLGAALGTVMCGFALLPGLGNLKTTLFILALNIAIGVTAFQSSSEAEPPLDRPAAVPMKLSVLMALTFISGFLGLLLEIAWTRLLAPVLGSSTYAFTTILATYLIGIGIGGLLVGFFGSEREHLKKGLGIAYGALALMVLVSLMGVNALPDFFLTLGRLAGPRPALFFIGQFLICSALMLLPCVLMGLILPLTMSLAGTRSVGSLYAANTVGGALGALFGGVFLLPTAGVTWTVIGASSVFLAAAAWLLRRRWKYVAGFGAAFLTLGTLMPDINFRRLHFGGFRGVLKQTGSDAPVPPRLIFHKEGLLCGVTVYRSPDGTALHVNGKPDASTGGDLSTQYLIAHLPLFLKRNAKTVHILGYGSGASVRAAADHPVDLIDVTELEPAILEADRFFYSVNDNVRADPRVRIHLEDGRSFLRFNKQRYDVIILEPSNPWIEGIGSLFTKDFYEMAAGRLENEGLLGLWVQNYEISKQTLDTILTTLQTVFPNAVVLNSNADLMIVASKKPIGTDYGSLEAALKALSGKPSLARLDIRTPYDLMLGYMFSFPEDKQVFASSVINTDDNGWLEYRAPYEMYLGVTSQLMPLSVDTYLPRYRRIFFPDKTLSEIALGLADAVVRKRPYAPQRIDGYIASVDDRSVKPALEKLKTKALNRAGELEANAARIGNAQKLLAAREWKKAEELLKQSLKVEETGFALRLVGLALEQQKKPDEAAIYFERALKLNPDDFFSERKVQELSRAL